MHFCVFQFECDIASFWVTLIFLTTWRKKVHFSMVYTSIHHRIDVVNIQNSGGTTNCRRVVSLQSFKHLMASFLSSIRLYALGKWVALFWNNSELAGTFSLKLRFAVGSRRVCRKFWLWEKLRQLFNFSESCFALRYSLRRFYGLYFHKPSSLTKVMRAIILSVIVRKLISWFSLDYRL